MSVDIAAAFNAGCQARLDGLPLADCPYLRIAGPDGSRLVRAWARGWKDVHRFYGTEAKRPFRKLPPVQPATLTGCGRHSPVENLP